MYIYSVYIYCIYSVYTMYIYIYTCNEMRISFFIFLWMTLLAYIYRDIGNLWKIMRV